MTDNASFNKNKTILFKLIQQKNSVWDYLKKISISKFNLWVHNIECTKTL